MYLLQGIKPSGSAVRISQKWLWTLNISYTKNIQIVYTHFTAEMCHPGVDPETRWGSYVLMATIKPSGSAVRISQQIILNYKYFIYRYTKIYKRVLEIGGFDIVPIFWIYSTKLCYCEFSLDRLWSDRAVKWPIIRVRTLHRSTEEMENSQNRLQTKDLERYHIRFITNDMYYQLKYTITYDWCNICERTHRVRDYDVVMSDNKGK